MSSLQSYGPHGRTTPEGVKEGPAGKGFRERDVGVTNTRVGDCKLKNVIEYSEVLLYHHIQCLVILGV
jgi:hypothetical protein